MEWEDNDDRPHGKLTWVGDLAFYDVPYESVFVDEDNIGEVVVYRATISLLEGRWYLVYKPSRAALKQHMLGQIDTLDLIKASAMSGYHTAFLGDGGKYDYHERSPQELLGTWAETYLPKPGVFYDPELADDHDQIMKFFGWDEPDLKK